MSKLLLNFTINQLPSLLIGVAFGFAIAALYFLNIKLRTIKVERKTNKKTIKNKDISKIINKYESQTKQLIKEKKLNQITDKYLEIIKEIASLYSDKKNAIIDFSIHDAFKIINYLSIEIDRIIKKLNISLLTKLKLSVIYTVYTKGYSIKKSTQKPVDWLKKHKISTILIWIYRILNPLAWFNSLVTTPIINSLINDLIISSISLVAQEADSIYSKQVLENDKVKKSKFINLLLDSHKDDKKLVKIK